MVEKSHGKKLCTAPTLRPISVSNAVVSASTEISETVPRNPSTTPKPEYGTGPLVVAMNVAATSACGTFVKSGLLTVTSIDPDEDDAPLGFTSHGLVGSQSIHRVKDTFMLVAAVAVNVYEPAGAAVNRRPRTA